MEYTILTILFTIPAIWGGRRGATLKSFGPHVRALLWAQIYLRPSLINPKRRIMRRARTLMENPEYLTVYGGMLSTFIFIFCILLLFNTSFFIPTIAFVLTFIIVRMVNLESDSANAPNYQATMLESVAKKYVRYASGPESALFLKELMSYRTPEAMNAACKGFQLLPDEFFHPSCPDKNPRKPQQLFSEEVLEEAGDWNDLSFESAHLDQILEEAEVAAATAEEAELTIQRSNMNILPDEIERFKKLKLKRFHPFLQRSNATLAIEAQADLIDQLLIGNYPYEVGLEHLYCTKCNAFAEHKFEAEWNWVWCRQCNDVDGLEFDFKQVIGRIGGIMANKPEEGVRELSLWNSDSNTAISADIDRLEIIGGERFDYDWAINAVLEQFNNKGSKMRGFELVMVDSPEIHINTQRFLEKFEKEHQR